MFESRADLTGYESAGKAQLFRYDVSGETLQCLSCSQVGATPDGDTTLIAPLGQFGFDDPSGLKASSVIENLSPDGRRAFFETSERLVVEDIDGLADVYEWEAEGKGSCAEPGGCVFLISSGQSARPDHLFGVSESGDDVFILTAEQLAVQDTDDTPSVYDARVGGGFPPPVAPPGECLGESCLPTVAPPDDPTPTSASYRGLGNVPPNAKAKRCRAGQRKVRKAGKARCVRNKKNRRYKRSRTAGRADR